MCMLVDSNILSALFRKTNIKHQKYEKVLDWFLFGRAKIVMGGKYYEVEIKEKMCSFIPFLKELARFGKIHYFNNDIVDRVTEKIIKMETDSDFDDPHVIALLSLSEAKIFCSEDERSFRFISDKKYYQNNTPPKIVCLLHHKTSQELLNDSNICSKGIHKRLPEKVALKIKEKICNT